MTLIYSKHEDFNLQAFDVLSLAMLFGPLTYGVKAFVSNIGLTSFAEISSMVIYLLWIVLFIRFLWNNKFMLRKLIVAEFLYLLIIKLNIHFFPETGEYFEEYSMFIRQIIVVYIPSLVVAFSIYDFNSGVEAFRKTGIIGILFMVFCYFTGFIDVWDYQYYGVFLCPFVLINYTNYLKNNKLIDLIFTLIGSFFIMMGGRQSLVGIAIGAIVMYYTKIHRTLDLRKMIISIIGLLCASILLMLVSPFLIKLIIFICHSFGIESRNVEMLESSEVFDTSTRDQIYEYSIDFIVRNGTSINGLLADQVYFSSFASWVAYPHNIFLELMIDFGFFWGGILSITIIYLYAKRLLFGSYEKRLFIGMFCTIVLVRLLVSSSFIIEGLFYTIIGLLLNNKDINRLTK